jgi:membrane protease YdiL (CAAX protease family)
MPRRLPTNFGVQESARFGMDGLAWFLLFAATITGFFIFTQSVNVDVAMAQKALFMPIFAFSAIMLRFLATGFVKAGSITSGSVLRSVIGGALAYGVLIIIAILPAATTMSTLELPQQLFYGNMAIIEEVFFCFLILAVGATMTRYGLLGALLMTAVLFPIFHVGVYGIDNLQFMAVAFGARMLLSIVYYVTGSLSAVMIAHVAFNVVATPGSILIPEPVMAATLVAVMCLLVLRISSRRLDCEKIH